MQSILSLANSLPVEVCVQTSQGDDSSPWILTRTLHSTPWSPWKHQVDCNTIFRGRVSKLSSKFYQNSVPDTLKLKCPTAYTFFRGHSRVLEVATNRHQMHYLLRSVAVLSPDFKIWRERNCKRRRKNVNTSQFDRWPIVSCWSYASTLPIFGMSPFIKLRSCFLCSRRNICPTVTDVSEFSLY